MAWFWNYWTPATLYFSPHHPQRQSSADFSPDTPHSSSKPLTETPYATYTTDTQIRYPLFLSRWQWYHSSPWDMNWTLQVQSAFALPGETGPYKVGTWGYVFISCSRLEFDPGRWLGCKVWMERREGRTRVGSKGSSSWSIVTVWKGWGCRNVIICQYWRAVGASIKISRWRISCFFVFRGSS